MTLQQPNPRMGQEWIQEWDPENFRFVHPCRLFELTHGKVHHQHPSADPKQTFP